MDYFEVLKKDQNGDVVESLKIKRVKRNKHTELFNLLKEPLYIFFKSNCAIGMVLSNEKLWKDLKKVALLLPVIGQDALGFKLEDIEEDYDQITRIFFTTSEIIEGELKDASQPKPSLIAQLHYFDYQGEITRVGRRLMAEQKSELNQAKQDINELESLIQAQ